MRPDRCWSATLALSTFGWWLLPAWRPVFSVSMAAHAGILAWGIADLRLQFFGPALFRSSNERHRLALTFDDGPDPLLTPAILDILKKYGFQATFFVVAKRACEYPAMVQRAFSEGHTIGCHDLTHAVTANFRRGAGMKRQIAEASGLIASVIGRPPLLYRPPVGLSNPHLFGALKKHGMQCIGWSRSTRDAGNRRKKAILRIGSLARGGSVILLHDCLPVKEYHDCILEQLEQLCASIVKQKLEPVGVDRLFGIEAYATGTGR